jgi:hypothetical protein
MANSDSLELIDSGVIRITDAFLSMIAYLPDIMTVGTITRDENGAVTTAGIIWPDGTAGTYTALVASTDFLGQIDSYKVTYGTRTYTQPTMTRDENGAVTYRPEMVQS